MIAYITDRFGAVKLDLVTHKGTLITKRYYATLLEALEYLDVVECGSIVYNLEEFNERKAS